MNASSTNKNARIEPHELPDAANQQDLLQMMVSQLQDAAILLTLEGEIVQLNNAAIELLGYAPVQIESEHLHSIIRAPWKETFAYRFENSDHHSPFVQPAVEVELLAANGEGLPLSVSLSFMPIAEGYLLANLRDLRTQKAELRKLARLAATDPLTGLANRRTFDERLTSAWQNCTKQHYPISVIVIDVDYFKQFNDRYGHIRGDHCLQLIAEAIANSVPDDSCLAARYGGEEFAVILPATSASTAQKVAGSIRNYISELCMKMHGVDSAVSVSQGIATEIQGQFRSAEALLFAADTAMYRAKMEGRDRINFSL
ncbi:GGDEF domain-containing protein [Shewanella mangrovi]|uniref:GGDEF domain-containing protein n=1 Tax=Shewanella mangrovi TaxID=1515746 RepID=UPI0006906817|nr:sensor domain-containing diguanylate cyclase [Shewanella mangrovi]